MMKKILTIINLTNENSHIIFALKQNKKTMKTDIIRIILCLCILTSAVLFRTEAQSELFDVICSENFVNQPSLCCFAKSFAAISVRNDFLTKELMYNSLWMSYSLDKNNIHGLIDHYGYSAYGLLRLGLGYGRDFGNKFSICARVFYILEHAKNYTARNSLCLDVSFSYRITKKLSFSATVYNPFKLNYGIIEKKPIPMDFNVLTIYQVSDKLAADVFVNKQLPGSWNIGGGFYAQILKPFSISMHCSNSNVNLNFKLVTKKNLIIYVSTSWYYKINISPEIGALYLNDFQAKKQ